MNYKVISQGEIEDATRVTIEQGYKPQDFVFSDECTSEVTQYPFPIHGICTVRRLTNNIEKKYQCGNKTAWVCEFEQDLKNGYFD